MTKLEPGMGNKWNMKGDNQVLQIKYILNDLVQQTYKDSPRLAEYKKFYVEISEKVLKSKHGDYNIKLHRIRIFNLYRSDAAIAGTTIHELAHHIDNVNRGTTDHGKEFYAEYQKLLYMGLDMGLFSKGEFLAATKDAADSNKVTKMIETYQIKDIGYRAGQNKISVKNCYEQRETLKQRGYQWNKINKAWERNVTNMEIEQEIKFLNEIALKPEIGNATAISLNRKEHIVAGKGSYDIKEALKKEGFHFTDKKKWEKEGTMDELLVYREKYPHVRFMMSHG